MKDKLEVYKDLKGEWRWHVFARNGELIAESGEAYATRWNARRAAKRFVRSDVKVGD